MKTAVAKLKIWFESIKISSALDFPFKVDPGRCEHGEAARRRKEVARNSSGGLVGSPIVGPVTLCGTLGSGAGGGAATAEEPTTHAPERFPEGASRTALPQRRRRPRLTERACLTRSSPAPRTCRRPLLQARDSASQSVCAARARPRVPAKRAAPRAATKRLRDLRAFCFGF